MDIPFQGKHDIKLYGTEGPIYIGDTVELRCTLKTDGNVLTYTALILVCKPCWSGVTQNTLLIVRYGEMTWKSLENGESSTEWKYRWTANETFSPLIMCGVRWHEQRGVGFNEDSQYLIIKGKYR